MTYLQIALVYFVLINITSFVMMGIDKQKAKTHKRRISEKALFNVVIVGGSIGGIAGMQVFRHKTKHWYFKYGFIIILLLQIILGIYSCNYFGGFH